MSDRAWSPEDKRVRCSNCAYLHSLGDGTHQCRNEEGPVAMWHFLDDQEPSQAWCEGFRPDAALGQQDMLPTLAEEFSALQDLFRDYSLKVGDQFTQQQASIIRLTEERDALREHLDLVIRAHGISNTPIPEVYQQAADRFNTLATPVPMTEVEKLPDPD